MTRLYATIITDDKRFERMLSLELSGRGVEVVTGELACLQKNKQGKLYILADLDFCKRDELSELKGITDVIGFSRSYKNELGDVAGDCLAFLHRPFLTDELISIIFDGADARRRIEKPRVKPKEHRYLAVDAVERCAIYGNERIMLTESEYKVLSLLCDRRGEAVSREEISDLLGTGESNNCDVYICMLRRKIDNRLGLKLICTVRGKGYVIPK